MFQAGDAYRQGIEVNHKYLILFMRKMLNFPETVDMSSIDIK